MLEWSKVKHFVISITSKPWAWPVYSIYSEVPEDGQKHVSDELNFMICALGRHDYKFKMICSEGVVLSCQCCGHEKVSALRGQHGDKREEEQEGSLD